MQKLQTTQNQGDSNTNKVGLLVRSHCVTMGSFSLYLFGEIAQNRCSQVLAVLTNKFCHGTAKEVIEHETT